MTRRERMQAVFEERSVAAPLASLRLDLWHADAVASGTLPAEVAGLSAAEVEDRLGFARAVRYRAHPRLVWSDARQQTDTGDEDIVERYIFPERTLVRRRRYTDAMRRQGIRPHTKDYPLREEADYDLLLKHMASARVELDTQGFSQCDADTSDAGLPMLIVDTCPAHMLMLEFAGYEQFFLHRCDFPGKVTALIQAIEVIYRWDLWPAVERTSARLVLHGAHFSSQMTPLPLFEACFLPYFSAFNARMHAAGKYVVWHADAEMNSLLDVVLEAQFDGADCLATTPLVPAAIESYFATWNGDIVCWGGLPGTIFDPSVPTAAFEEHVDHLVEITADRGDFIFGASDNIMPGADWSRLLYLADSIKATTEAVQTQESPA